jgi:hypothetical protein
MFSTVLSSKFHAKSAKNRRKTPQNENTVEKLIFLDSEAAKIQKSEPSVLFQTKLSFAANYF